MVGETLAPTPAITAWVHAASLLFTGLTKFFRSIHAVPRTYQSAPPRLRERGPGINGTPSRYPISLTGGQTNGEDRFF